MNWEGKIRWSTRMSASRLKVGSHYVPTQITMAGTGDNGCPDIRVEFAMSALGEARCVKFHIDAKDDGRGVATSDLAMVAVDQLTVSAFEQFAQEILYEDERGTGTAYSGGAPGDKQIHRAVDKGKQAREGEIVAVAKVYSEAERAPMKAVEDRLGYRRRTAARRVDLARKWGLLPEKGGAMTDSIRAKIAQAQARADDELSGPKQPSQDEIRSALRAHGHEA